MYIYICNFLLPFSWLILLVIKKLLGKAQTNKKFNSISKHMNYKKRTTHTNKHIYLTLKQTTGTKRVSVVAHTQ